MAHSVLGKKCCATRCDCGEATRNPSIFFASHSVKSEVKYLLSVVKGLGKEFYTSFSLLVGKDVH